MAHYSLSGPSLAFLLTLTEFLACSLVPSPVILPLDMPFLMHVAGQSGSAKAARDKLGRIRRYLCYRMLPFSDLVHVDTKSGCRFKKDPRSGVARRVHRLALQ